MSSIARAFTLRRKRAGSGAGDSSSDSPSPPSPPRSASMRYSRKPVDIKSISGPVQLLSTTNMLTYNAPDVAQVQAQRNASTSISSGSSSRASDDGSDASSTSSRSRDTQLTDASSVGSVSPVASPTEKKMCFESTHAAKRASTLRRAVSTQEVSQHSFLDEDAPELPRSESPAIPQRHPSHSKKAHAELARKRSMQAMSSPSVTRAHSIASTLSTPKEGRASLDFFGVAPSPSSAAASPAPPAHPFGKELEQLDEVAEEFNVVVSGADYAHDLQAMRQCGLVRFCAAEYIAEIQPLFGRYVHTHLSESATVAWI